MKRIILYSIIAISFVFFNCTPKENNTNTQALAKAKALLENGDLVVRLEDDFQSYLVAGLSNKDKSYSHCGIVKKEKNNIFIYNILPVGDPKNPEEIGVRKTPIDSFLDHQQTVKFGVYRYDITNDEKTKMISKVEQFRNNNVSYDAKFSYQTDTAIYCSELISKALESATNNTMKIEQSYIDNTKIMGVRNFFKFMNDTVDLSKYPIVTIDVLYLNNFTKKIFEYQYDPKLRNRAKLKK